VSNVVSGFREAVELASTRSGTLQVSVERAPVEAYNGMTFQARLRNDRTGRAAARQILAGGIGVSVGYSMTETRPGYLEIVNRAGLFEISLTPSPLYKNTWCRLNFVNEAAYWELVCGRD
jgi:phage head maturation protease